MTQVISMIIRLKDDKVMAFDTEGEQIPEYQGQYEDVSGGILRDAPPDAVFNHWFINDDRPRLVAREEW